MTTQNSEPSASASAAGSPPAASGSHRSALLIVFLVVFIDLLGFGIVLPLLPRIAKDYVEVVLPGRTGPIIGMLMASFSLMQFLVAPLWGRTSDRVGRRPILLIGLCGSVVFYALFGVACLPALRGHALLVIVLLFAARIGQGIAGATIATAQAVIADSTPPEKRKHGMALIGAAFGIGFTFGPLLGAGSLYLWPDHFEAIGFTAAGLSFIALLLGLWLLPETRQATGQPYVRRGWLDWSALRFALANSAIGPVVITFFLASFGFGAFESTLALLLRDSFGLDAEHSFLAFAYVGFVLMLAQGVFYRRLASRFSEAAFMGFGIVMMALGVGSLGVVSYLAAQIPSPITTQLSHVLAAIGIADVGPIAYFARRSTAGSVVHNAYLLPALCAGLTAAVFGFAFLTPSAQALISRRTPSDRQGEILGVNQSASAMARILGPLVGLILYEATPSHLWPYAFGAAVLAGMLPMLPRISRGA